MSSDFEALKRLVDHFQDEDDRAKAKAKEIPPERRCYVEGSSSGWTFTINEHLPSGHIECAPDVFEAIKRQYAHL